MTPLNTSLIFIIFTFSSLALTANALCLRNVNGHIFNLCPFNKFSLYSLPVFSNLSKSPVNISYNIMPYWGADMSFGIAKNNVPSCNNSTVNGWFSGVNTAGECATVVDTEPSFYYTQQITGLPGVKIDYVLDNSRGNLTLNLLCNQTAAHDTNVDFFVEGVVNESLSISGYSYYGCPVKAADEKFLSF